MSPFFYLCFLRIVENIKKILYNTRYKAVCFYFFFRGVHLIKIYLVRHCEALGNKLNSFQGSLDADITELGEKQLSFLEKRFSNIHIDKAFSSPLTRAYKTALAATRSKDITVEKEPLFSEINGGSLEGKSFDEIFKEYPFFTDVWDNHPDKFSAPGGETMQQLYARVVGGLEKIISNGENEGKTILISSHGAAIRCLICHIMYGSIDNLSKTPWSVNTAVSLITYNNSSFSFEYLNDASHLPNEFKSQKSRLLVAEKKE